MARETEKNDLPTSMVQFRIGTDASLAERACSIFLLFTRLFKYQSHTNLSSNHFQFPTITYASPEYEKC